MTQLVRDSIRYSVALNHWIPRTLGHGAFTFRGVIRVAGPVLVPDLHCHEFRHILQETELGSVRFWLAYLWELRHGYHGNRFEVEAYADSYDVARVATFSEVRA